MNSFECFSLLNQINKTSSRLEKEQLLIKNKNDDFLKIVLNLGLNPFINFGVNKTISIPNKNGTNNFSNETFSIFDNLKERTLTGNKARNSINTHLETLNKESQELFLYILNKDFRAGFTKTTVNKIFINLIPDFKCMLAAPFKDKKLKPYVIIEPKYDGLRLLVYINNTDVSFFSRGGKEFYNFDFLKQELLKVLGTNHTNLILDGELTSATFNEIVSKAHTKDTQVSDAVFNIFDIPSYDTDQKNRKLKLNELFKLYNSESIRIVPYIFISSKHIQDHYKLFLSEGYEGAIVKDPSASYVNKRDTAWMKLKEINEMEVKIVSLFEGTGKNIGMMGGMNTISLDNKLTVSIGTGFSDEQRQEFWNCKDKLIGRIIEIKYQNETVRDSVRHPRFIKFRDSLTGEKE